jgi:hypothetical protein
VTTTIGGGRVVTGAEGARNVGRAVGVMLPGATGARLGVGPASLTADDADSSNTSAVTSAVAMIAPEAIAARRSRTAAAANDSATCLSRPGRECAPTFHLP